MTGHPIRCMRNRSLTVINSRTFGHFKYQIRDAGRKSACSRWTGLHDVYGASKASVSCVTSSKSPVISAASIMPPASP